MWAVSFVRVSSVVSQNHESHTTALRFVHPELCLDINSSDVTRIDFQNPSRSCSSYSARTSHRVMQ